MDFSESQDATATASEAHTMGVARRYWADASQIIGKLAMAFVPDADATPRSLWAMSLAWSNELIAELIFVREAGGRAKKNPKVELPYVALRAAFHIRVPQMLRLDSSMGLSFLRSPLDQQLVFALLNVPAENQAESEQVLESCLGYWLSSLNDFVGDDPAGLAAIARAQALNKSKQAFALKGHAVHTLPWRKSPATNTTAIQPQDRDAQRFAYAALAEEAAIALVGHELLPGTGALRRVLDGDPGRNQAVLLTPPVRVSDGEFSFCITLHVETVPSFQQPLVLFDISKRRWIGGPLKDRFGSKTIKGHVFVDSLPDRVLTFSALRKEKVDNEYQVETCQAFDYIAATYGLPLGLTSGRRIAVRDYPDVDKNCRIRLTYANGITQAKHPLDVGIPEKDWIDAYKAAAGILSSVGLLPLQDFTQLKLNVKASPLAQYVLQAQADSDEDDEDELGDPKKARQIINVATMLNALKKKFAQTDDEFFKRYGFLPEDAKLSKKDLYKDDHSERLRVVQCINEYAIKSLNPEKGAVLLLIYDRDYPKTEIGLVKDMASILFSNGIHVESHFLPADAHGPKARLPDSSADTEKRFRARVKAWESLGQRIRAVTDTGKKVYCLVMAREWYPGEKSQLHDDPINKPAARNALITLGGAMSQYLLPMGMSKDGKVELENFNQRVQSALKDLLLAHSGSAVPFDTLAESFFLPDMLPKEVVGITVVRNQGGRINKADSSFVLCAFRQRAISSQCDIRFAYASNGNLRITEWTDMASGIAEIAAATPCWLSNESDGRTRQSVNKDRYQEFIKTVLDDCQQRKSNAVVFIDSTNASALWPWLTDMRINPSDIAIGTLYKNMQQNWKGLRIVRTRQQIAPLLVDDKIRTIRKYEDGEVVATIAVPSSTSGLFKVGKAQTGPVAFWSVMPTGSQVKRGSSCYRETLNTKRLPGTATSGMMEVGLRAVHTNQWPTPNALEFVIGLSDESDDLNKIAAFCHNLRRQSLHYDDPTALPVPLYFEKVVRQYIAKFALGGIPDEEQADE